MHSLAMAQDILKAAFSEAEKHNAKQIKAISVKIGDRHFTEADSIQFCLEAVTKGTISEGAQIEVEPMNIATGDEPLQISLKLECKAFVKLNNYLQN